MVRRILGVFFLLLFASFKQVFGEGADVNLTIDASSNLGAIKPIWSSTATWKTWVWVNTPMVLNNLSKNWFVDYFPFYDSVRMMAPLGGNINPPIGKYCGTLYSCDVPEVLKDDLSYDFSYLDRAVENVLNAGLVPTFDMAQTPKVLASNPALICDGFKFYSSSIKDSRKWKEFLGTVIDHFNQKLGEKVVADWGFSSFNEADLGRPGVSSCSFSGTASQFVSEILKPTVDLFKEKGLLKNFHLGAMTFVDYPPLVGATIENDNETVGSEVWMNMLLSSMTSFGYTKDSFKSFALNMYGIYPDRHNIFWIKRSIDKLKAMLKDKGYEMPIRADELGIIHNDNSNTPVYESSFASSWFASVIKLYLDAGDVDKLNSWWYLLVRNGRTFNPGQWKRTLAFYTFLMYNQLANNQRLSVNGGVFDESILVNVDAVAGKDSHGVIRTILFNHHDRLSDLSADVDPNAPILDRRSRKVRVVFNNLEGGFYHLSKFQATDENIVTSPSELPLVESFDLSLGSTFDRSFDIPHHSVILIKLEKNRGVLRIGWNKVWLDFNSRSLLPCVESFRNVGFWRRAKGVTEGGYSDYLRCFRETSY